MNNRILTICWYASIGLYILSYFLPAIESRLWVPNLIGYEAAQFTFLLLFDFDLDKGFDLIGTKAFHLFLAMANVGFISILLASKYFKPIARLIISCLVTFSVAYWWIDSLFDNKDSINELQIGYWIWHLSVVSFLLFDYLKRRTATSPKQNLKPIEKRL